MTRGLSELGVTLADLQALQRLPLLQAQQALAALKDRVRANFRRLSKELHPDTNGGDAGKTERFMAVVAVKAELDKIQLQARPIVHKPTPVTAPQMGVTWFNPFGNPEVGVPITISMRARKRNGV